MVDLDSQLSGVVVSSTKTALKASQTPAIVTVVGADEIQARGYTSLADILRAVPGFYDVYDLATHNVGVRGVNGGVRASGNVLKVMIDGQPVDFRPDTGNFFGEELIPIEAVDRVEIIRGPASALYGANAFLGVVNVITRAGEAAKGVKLTGRANMVRSHFGGGGTVMAGASEGPAEFLIAASYDQYDRSGLALPSSSPALNKVIWPLPPIPYSERGASKNDVSRPKSFLGKASFDGIAGGKLSLLATVQSLDSVGEFQDFATLYHGTRLALVNQNYRVGYDLRASDRVTLKFTGNYFVGAPGAQERIAQGRPDYVLLRRTGADGYGMSAEATLVPVEPLTLIFGSDLVRERHDLETFDQLLTEDVRSSDGSILRKSGTIIPGQQSGAKEVFVNVGAFGQGIITLGRGMSATAGARVDYHNIYGVNPSGRLGLVYAPDASPLSLKLLYGSSFKAPSAVQLYTQPMGLGDIQGNDQLKSQTAHTVEAAAGYKLPDDRGEVSLNLYGTDIYGRVEFLQNGSLFLEAANLPSEQIVGGELDARIRVTNPFNVRLAAGVAKTVARDTGTFLIGLPEVTNPLFPTYQLHLIGDYRLPWLGLRLSGEASLIGARSSSQSNAVVKTSAYELAPYVYTAASLSTAGRKIFGDRETSFALRVTDLLNTRWTEPGFGGVDVPTVGRTAVLSVTQSL